MTPAYFTKKECEARLRSLLPADEPVLAVGTAEELPELLPDLGSGTGGDFLVVTPERLVFAGWGVSVVRPREIVFDDVTHWADGTQYNSYAVVLTHQPMPRREHVPAHRFLWFEWGNAFADVVRPTTIFRFSRPDTNAAKKLRSLLKALPIEHEVLRFAERTREERTRGSHARLTATNQHVEPPGTSGGSN